MGKLLSERERKLQRKLIPLNIFVCILALTAVFSIIFAPFIKVDFGKILNNEATISLVEQAVNSVVGASAENGDNGEGSVDAGSTSVDFMPVIASIVVNAFKNAEGSITVSAYGASKIALSSGDDKAQKVLDEFFFGDEALVMKLVDSIADGVSGMLKSDEGKNLIEEVVVESIANSLVEKLADGTAAENLTGDQISSLTETLRKLESSEGESGVNAVADEFVNQLAGYLGDDFDSANDGDTVRNYIKDMYSDTAENNGGKYSFEAMISISVSKNVDLKNYNINGMFGGGNNDGDEGAVIKRAVADEAEGEPSEQPVPPESGNDGEGEETVPPESGDNGEGEETVPPESGDNGEGEETVPPESGDDGEGGETVPPESGTETEDGNTICTNYEQILEQLGFSEDNAELKANLRTALHNMVDGYVGSYSGYMGYYGYVFYGMLVLALPWLILFLFSFFHMLAKNKRFMMWYVKLFGFIPTLVSTAIFMVKMAVKYELMRGLADNVKGLIGAIISGFSSYMWIVTICYTLLWLVSVCWAFPIKHKIRKERKLVKMYGSSDGYTDGGKKSKKEKKNKSAKSSANESSYKAETRQETYGRDDDYDDGGFNAPYYGDDYYDYK